MRNEVSGGASCLMADIMHRCFFNSDAGCHMPEQGLVLDLSDLGDMSELVTLVAVHAVTIADEKALMEVFMNKGHTGTKPCGLCRNIVDFKCQHLAHDTSGLLIPSSDLNVESWARTADVDVRRIMHRLGVLCGCADRGEITMQT